MQTESQKQMEHFLETTHSSSLSATRAGCNDERECRRRIAAARGP